MKFADLKERSTSDLAELKASLKKDVFASRMKNHTGQLADTSSIRKARRDVARIETILVSRAGAEGSKS